MVLRGSWKYAIDATDTSSTVCCCQRKKNCLTFPQNAYELRPSSNPFSFAWNTQNNKSSSEHEACVFFAQRRRPHTTDKWLIYWFILHFGSYLDHFCSATFQSSARSLPRNSWPINFVWSRARIAGNYTPNICVPLTLWRYRLKMINKLIDFSLLLSVSSMHWCESGFAWENLNE